MRFALFAAAAALSFAAPAQAAELIVTGSFDSSGGSTQSIQKFAPVLGTLTQIILKQKINIGAFNYGYAPGNATYRIDYTHSSSSIFGTIFEKGSEIVDVAQGALGLGFGKTYQTVTDFKDLALLTGAGNATIYHISPGFFTATLLSGIPMSLGQQDGYFGGTYEITYIYDPSNNAIPEPATWAMMISGFGLVGAGMRRNASRLSAFA